MHDIMMQYADVILVIIGCSIFFLGFAAGILTLSSLTIKMSARIANSISKDFTDIILELSKVSSMSARKIAIEKLDALANNKQT